MDKINVVGFGTAFGITFACFYAAFIIFFAMISEGGAIIILNSLFHVDITTIIKTDLSFLEILTGVLSSFAFGWITGVLIAIIYNRIV